MIKRTLSSLLLFLPVLSFGSVTDRLYDFTDTYYASHGIDASKLGGRKTAPSKNAVVDVPNFPYQTDVRIISTNVGYGASGSPIFFSILGGGGPEIFSNNSLGVRAKQIADSYDEFIFPMKGGNPTGIPNGRQSLLHGNNNGYFSNDPLGLWLHVFVNYTDKAFTTSDGKKALADLAKKNGLALDGTPLITNVSDLDKLYQKGYVTKLTTNDATRYAICPEIEDPRRGGIAPDDFANFLVAPNGSLLEPYLSASFHSLQTTGDWPKNNP